MQVSPHRVWQKLVSHILAKHLQELPSTMREYLGAHFFKFRCAQGCFMLAQINEAHLYNSPVGWQLQSSIFKQSLVGSAGSLLWQSSQRTQVLGCCRWQEQHVNMALLPGRTGSSPVCLISAQRLPAQESSSPAPGTPLWTQ